jgi:hypothetical protein
VEPVPTIPALKPVPANLQTGRPANKAKSYTELKITTPKAEEHFVNNAGQVTIGVEITPELQDGHQLNLTLNGEHRAGPTTSTSFSFSNLDRGTYTAIVNIVDKAGTIIKASTPVVFHVQRARVKP